MLVALDFDGTLSDSEMTVLLGEQVGAAAEMAAITEQAMNDELAYAASLRRRCTLLAGLDLDTARDALGAVTLRPGTRGVLNALRTAGVETAILTGGFERGVERALAEAGTGVDTVVANRLLATDGALTGEVTGPLVEGTKDDALTILQAATGETETVAVGDGANDRPMLAAADLAVGFAPKPAVEPVCDVVVDSMTELRAVFETEGVLPERA
jgi:phosphoserine phosphatase